MLDANSSVNKFVEHNLSIRTKRTCFNGRHFNYIFLVIPSEVDWAKAESAEISLICLDLTHLFMVDHRFRANMKKCDYENPLMKIIFDVGSNNIHLQLRIKFLMGLWSRTW